MLDDQLTLIPMKQDEHLEAVYQLETSSQRFPWSKKIFSDCLSAGYFCQVLTLSENTKLRQLLPEEVDIAGFGIVMPAVDEVHLLNIAIHPAVRQQRLGAWLLEALKRQSKRSGGSKMLLEVRVSNVSAIGLYRKMGFQVVGVRKNYYPADEGRENALVMSSIL